VRGGRKSALPKAESSTVQTDPEHLGQRSGAARPLAS
jgi:hypothetical protein